MKKNKQMQFPSQDILIQGPLKTDLNVTYLNKFCVAYTNTFFNKTIDDIERICSWEKYALPKEVLDIDKPYVSFIAPAIRNLYYEDFYNFIKETNNGISFEVIFVGNVMPLKTMPCNFKYIYSEESPSKCLEIAAINAKGEYLIPCSDDCIYSPQFICLLWNWKKRDNMSKSLLTWRRVENGMIDDSLLNFPEKLDKNIFIGNGGMFDRYTWHKIGGIDSRFSFTHYAVIDMQLRFYENGYNPYCVNVCFSLNRAVEDKNNNRLSNSEINLVDYEFLKKMWIKDNSISSKRLDSVISF